MSLAKRQAFTLIKKAYEKINRKPVTTPSTLRLIVPLTANRTSFTFPILEGDSNLSHPNQVLLNRADAFTATQMGLFVGGIDIAKGPSGLITQPITPSDLGNEYITCDPTLFLDNAGLPNVNSFALFNNSNIDIAVNNVKYLQNFDTNSMNKGTNLVNNTTLSSNQVNTSGNTNGLYGERDGFVELVPTIQLSGTSKIDITLNSPIAVYTGTQQLYLEIIFRGFLSLGASNLNK